MKTKFQRDVAHAARRVLHAREELRKACVEPNSQLPRRERETRFDSRCSAFEKAIDDVRHETTRIRPVSEYFGD